jgi:crotonobetainyl-CoA:carnitine CoA-transferase CaiB-like acyl-CoA transferase
VALSRGKRSLTLDLRDPRAVPVLERLVAAADVVIENALPGTMEQRGFGYPQAKAANPGIVWCAITGYGQDGPQARHTGHDINFLAHAGVLSALSTDRDWHPSLPLALQTGALAAVVAIQAVLIRRGVGGEGAFVDVSLSEAALWLLTCGVNPMSPQPYAIPRTPDRRTYACADGRHVAIACAEPRTWGALCTALDLPDLAPQLHKWDDAAAAEAALAAVFATASAADWFARLSVAGAAISLVNHGEDLLHDPQIAARGAIAEVAGVPVPAPPFRIDGAAGPARPLSAKAPGRVGDDTAAALAEAGFSPTEIAEFAESGLV